ncbi:MAG: metallophosphoesterase [Acidobacteriia bacterium]|nr:metallophosphoesterase [Terriglobia bacterium]
MKISIDPVLASRIRTAWAKLSPSQQSQIAAAVLAANQQALSVAQSQSAPPGPAQPHHLMFAQSALTNDSDGLVNSLEAGIVIDVGSDGAIWGTGKYEQLDPGWVEAFAVFLESLIFGRHPFMGVPQTVRIPDTVTIAMAGDWGTGDWRTAANPAPSTDVRIHLAMLRPEITIHLGDVYYAGTGDQEQHLLVNLWPAGSLASFALNSNHEMYSGANPYFQAIAKAPFAAQQGCSYFALENDNWVIVGLDSAYFAAELELYLNGSLGPAEGTQVQFLQQFTATNKKVIVLTHHNGLTEDGSSETVLWGQVMSGFPAGNGPAYWYWGHVHVGAVYRNQDPQGRNVACRCCGHGGLPLGNAAALENAPNVAWYEKEPANDPDIPQRVQDGFVVLRLDGPNIEEKFYNENGGVAWFSS